MKWSNHKLIFSIVCLRGFKRLSCSRRNGWKMKNGKSKTWGKLHFPWLTPSWILKVNAMKFVRSLSRKQLWRSVRLKLGSLWRFSWFISQIFIKDSKTGSTKLQVKEFYQPQANKLCLKSQLTSLATRIITNQKTILVNLSVNKVAKWNKQETHLEEIRLEGFQTVGSILTKKDGTCTKRQPLLKKKNCPTANSTKKSSARLSIICTKLNKFNAKPRRSTSQKNPKKKRIPNKLVNHWGKLTPVHITKASRTKQKDMK